MGVDLIEDVCVLCGGDSEFSLTEAHVCGMCRTYPVRLFAVAHRRDSDILREKATRLTTELYAALQSEPPDGHTAHLAEEWLRSGQDPMIRGR